MPRERREHVHGPFKHGNRWRVVLVGATGKRSLESFATEREAKRFILHAKAEAASRSVRSAVDAHLVAMRDRGLRGSTILRAEYHLDALLQLDHMGTKPLPVITPKVAATLYDELRHSGVSVDSQRNALAAGKAWGRWCAAKGWLPADPFADVKPIGRRKRGKPQPRLTEARKFFDYCLSVAENDQTAVAVATTLALGVRSSEIATRDVRDLDDDGRLLWIPDAKTESGRRTVVVPEILRPHLVRVAGNRKPTQPLFRKRDGERADRHWLQHHTERLARKARLPTRVSPQALRGLHATLARVGGSTSEAVASQLGHSSVSVQALSYVDNATLSAHQRDLIAQILRGNFSSVSSSQTTNGPPFGDPLPS